MSSLNEENRHKHVNVKNLLEIATALSREKDFNKLLSRILIEAMDITNCDGGTLYLMGEGSLSFKIMRTISMNFYKGEKGEKIELPPVPITRKNVCACAALEKELINVPDVYESEKYDFSGPRNYDKMTGYRTKSMLVVPMENHYGDIIGVLQLINALDEDGQIIAFGEKFEEVIGSLSSLAAVAITNMNYLEEVKELFNSFVRVISKAIDERTPYNANHTRNMVRYGGNLIDYLNEEYKAKRGELSFSDNNKEEFLMSIWFHDMGKMVIPTKVMNKETRLGPGVEKVRDRFEKMKLLNKIRLLEGKISEADFESLNKELDETKEFIEKSDIAGFLPNDSINKILELGDKKYEDENGEILPWVTKDELRLLTIQKGTLSEDERRIMESHVIVTEKLLSEINFSKEYSHVTEWASRHHEFLDGTGYPKRLKAKELPFEVRALTIIDIFDALTASDRPYKKAMPAEKALFILEDMVKEGKIDGEVLRLFKESRAWETK